MRGLGDGMMLSPSSSSSVSCIIMQNTGAGVETSVSTFWDVVNDDYCLVRWPVDTKQEGQTIACFVLVSGILL